MIVVVSVAWCLLLKCPTVCWLCYSLFATLDINATWVILERIYWRRIKVYFFDQWGEVQGHYAENRQATSLSLHLYTSILRAFVIYSKHDRTTKIRDISTYANVARVEMLNKHHTLLQFQSKQHRSSWKEHQRGTMVICIYLLWLIWILIWTNKTFKLKNALQSGQTNETL